MKKAKLSSLEYNKVLKNLESNSHVRKQKQKHLPRINTEISRRRLATEGSRSIDISICHGLTRNFTEISRSRISHGNKTLLSEPDA